MKNTDSITRCAHCDRGGRGNAVDKCSPGWRVTDVNSELGCFLGEPIVGAPMEPKKLTRGQARYQRYLVSGDCFDSFINFCYVDSAS